MSYGVHAYAVDLSLLSKAIGSGDAVLAKRLTKKYVSDLRSTDEIDFDEGLTPAADCLTSLVIEGPPDDDDDLDDTPGYKFGYALEILCRALGEWLPNSAFSGMGSEYFDAIDAALKKAKSNRRMSSFVFRGSPVPLPEIEDFPAIGWLAPEEVVAWKTELGALLGEPAAPRATTQAKKHKNDADAAKAFAKVVADKRAKGYKDDLAQSTFSGRVEGKKLVVSAAGKKTVTEFPTNKAAQKALISALRTSNSGGAKPGAASPVDDDALDGLRELLSWLESTATKKLAIVSFYY